MTSRNSSAITYDATGNRTLSGYVTGDGNRVTTDGTWTYTYDLDGNQVGKSKSGTTWTYSYDHRGQMTAASDGTTTVSYAYDAFGNRIGRTEDDGTTVTEARFVVDGWDPAKPYAIGTENFDTILDLDGTGAVTDRRVFGAGFDDVVARQDSSGAVSWYATDRLGSVRAVFDNSGTVTGATDYDAFGGFLGGVPVDRYAFTGREWDAALDLQYSRGRMYDPAAGRWTGEDPIRQAAGDANLYRYVGNGATNGRDPSGLYVIIDDGAMSMGWKNFFNYFEIDVSYKHIEGNRIAVIPKDPAAVQSKLAQDDQKRADDPTKMSAFDRRVLESLIFFYMDLYIGTKGEDGLLHSPDGATFDSTERGFVFGEILKNERAAKFLLGERENLRTQPSASAACSPQSRTPAQVREYKRLLDQEQTYLQDNFNRMIAKGKARANGATVNDLERERWIYWGNRIFGPEGMFWEALAAGGGYRAAKNAVGPKGGNLPFQPDGSRSSPPSAVTGLPLPLERSSPPPVGGRTAPLNPSNSSPSSSMDGQVSGNSGTLHQGNLPTRPVLPGPRDVTADPKSAPQPASPSKPSLSQPEYRSFTKHNGIPDKIDLTKPNNVWGLDAQGLQSYFRRQGFAVERIQPPKAKTSGLAKTFKLECHPTITEVQYHPGGGTVHKGSYYKFTMKDGTTIKIIDPATYVVRGPELKTTYFNSLGQRMQYTDGKWKVIDGQ